MSDGLERKNAFLMYHDYKQHFELLSIEERGTLITDLLEYAISKELPPYAKDQTLNRVLAMAFSIMTRQIDRDNERYEETCEKNRANANKRWSKDKDKKPDLYKIARENAPYGTYEEDGKGGLIVRDSTGEELGIVTPDGQYKHNFGHGGIRYHT